jgi:hypothetical protein
MVTEAAFSKGDVMPQREEKETTAATGETTRGGDEEVRWEVVAIANGLAQAAIIQGRLEAEGIPARIHQEPAGVAIGLTVGTLGQAKVLVPEPMAEEALRILEEPDREREEDEED